MTEVILAGQVFGACLLGLVAVVLVVGRRLNDRFWKATDLVWLGVALAGLLGVAEKLHQQELQRDIDEKLAKFQNDLNVTIALTAGTSMESLHHAVETLAENPNTKPSEKVGNLLHDTGKLRNLHVILQARGTDPSLFDNDLLAVFLTEQIKNSDHKELLTRQFRTFHGDRANLERAVAAKQQVGWMTWLDRNSPYLLAFAVALRLTRVFAEVVILGWGAGWTRGPKPKSA